MKLIFSADNNWGIGRDNQLLFRARADLARFKKMTTGKVVIMGRATLESLPKSKPLPERVNIVLTSNVDYTVPGAHVYHSLPQLFEAVKKYSSEDLFVIGGETLYMSLLPYCDTAYVTRFLADAPADRFMPDFDKLQGWELVGRSEEMCEEGLSFRFDEYKQPVPEVWA